MKIKQIVNLASFYAKKVKNGEFKANRAKQEIKSVDQTSLTRLKNNQKTECLAESQTQRSVSRLDGLNELRGLNGLRGMYLAEYGRSMVEMLGVLAVIGVLSVAGIAGYRYAMEKYRSNDIVYEVNLRATDIWNRYQRMPLPEPSESGKDFLEFAQTTASGFPIYMKSIPDVAFRVFVGEVSPRICKSVLNMPLINVIKGLQFVQVNDVKYTGNVEICGDMSGNIQNEMVFTIFLNSESDSLVNENCVEDADCSSCCGTPTCDENTLTCRDECSGNASTPYCNQEQCACVECLTPKDCAERGANYTCSEITNTCVEVPAECEFGKEFRTPNGVCVPCSNPNNFLVSLTPFENSALDFKDEQSGKEQCSACTNPTRFYGDVDDEKAYCSYACTNGYTYQASDGSGCVPCSDTDIHLISGDSVSKTQCDACADHFWFRSFNGSFYCIPEQPCSSKQFLGENQCRDCSVTSPYAIQTLDISQKVNQNYFSSLYNSCLNKTARIFGYGRMYCLPKCEQPANAPELCEDPTNCNRVWQNISGQCLPCNDTKSNNQVFTTDEVGKSLCSACGRKVKSSLNVHVSYCVYEQDCEIGKFRGLDGKCYSCTTGGNVQIEENDVTCEKNCSNTQQQREKRVGSNEIWYCTRKCGDGEILNSNGICRSCGGYDSFMLTFKEDCESRCPDTRKLYKNVYTFCSPKTCDPNDPYFVDEYGICYLCSTDKNSTQGKPDSTSCVSCGNRVFVDNMCLKANPGTSGICNSLDPVPSELNSDLKLKAQPYADGAHDGELFRGYDGYCYECSDQNISPSTTTAQCNSCGNRRMSNGKCQYGKCEETHQFLDTNNTCRDCSEKNIAVDPNEDNLCDSCDNRREMTLGNTATNNLTAKCVEECVPGLWQDSSGNCLLCSEGGNRAIGTDSESIALCNSCDNREAVASTNADGVITGYTCKQH